MLVATAKKFFGGRVYITRRANCIVGAARAASSLRINNNGGKTQNRSFALSKSNTEPRIAKTTLNRFEYERSHQHHASLSLCSSKPTTTTTAPIRISKYTSNSSSTAWDRRFYATTSTDASTTTTTGYKPTEKDIRDARAVQEALEDYEKKLTGKDPAYEDNPDLLVSFLQRKAAMGHPILMMYYYASLIAGPEQDPEHEEKLEKQKQQEEAHAKLLGVNKPEAPPTRLPPTTPLAALEKEKEEESKQQARISGSTNPVKLDQETTIEALKWFYIAIVRFAQDALCIESTSSSSSNTIRDDVIALIQRSLSLFDAAATVGYCNKKAIRTAKQAALEWLHLHEQNNLLPSPLSTATHFVATTAANANANNTAAAVSIDALASGVVLKPIDEWKRWRKMCVDVFASSDREFKLAGDEDADLHNFYAPFAKMHLFLKEAPEALNDAEQWLAQPEQQRVLLRVPKNTKNNNNKK